MPAKRYSVEQIVAKLREAEKHQGQGLTIPQSCKRLGISEQTFYRWRIKFEAIELFGDEDGKLDLEALANAPRTAREEKELRERRLLDELDLI